MGRPLSTQSAWWPRYHPCMDSPRRAQRRGHRTSPTTTDEGPRAFGPVDHDRFPDRETRLSIDGGRASQRFRDLLAESGPILADGAMGTMLFANGLQFGDPPEVWNLAHPDIVRRIQRGYLEAGSRILLTNTFGANRLRLGLHGLKGGPIIDRDVNLDTIRRGEEVAVSEGFLVRPAELRDER